MVKCNLCYSENKELLFRINANNVIKCTSCDLIYNENPMSEEEAKEYYENFYGGMGINASNSFYASGEDFRIFEANKRLDKILELNNKISSLLDVGCGLGFFLKAALQRNIETFGTEISDIATKYARAHGLNVISGDLLRLKDFDSKEFDLITFWASIEHLYDPRDYLEKANKLLRKDGFVVIETGDIGSYQARFFNKKWRLLQDDHNFYFSSKTLDKMLENTGYKIIRTDYDGFVESIASQFGLKDFLLKRFSEERKELKHRNSLYKEKINEAACKLKLGDVMIKYARKI